MNVLVAVSSKHGSTREIAEAIANELRAIGLNVDLRNIGDVTDVSRYDAIIFGSSVYRDRWSAEAKRFAELHATALLGRPVWVFSSGLVGVDGTPPARRSGRPHRPEKIIAATGARGYRIFAGRLDPALLNWDERILRRVLGVPTGDHRDWVAIRAWAQEIGAALHAGATVQRGTSAGQLATARAESA